MDINLEDGRRIHFPRISKGTGYADAVYRHEATSSEFYGAQIAWNGDGWTLDFRDGRRFLFPEAYHAKTFAQGAPFEMQAADGHRIQLKRNQLRNLEQLISPSGRTITLKYDAADRIIEATDDAGNVRNIRTIPTGSWKPWRMHRTCCIALSTRSFITRPTMSYHLTAVVDGRMRTLLENIYRDSDGGRISEQRLADGTAYRYQYIFVKDDIVKTIVEGPNGKREFLFQHGVFTREK